MDEELAVLAAEAAALADMGAALQANLSLAAEVAEEAETLSALGDEIGAENAKRRATPVASAEEHAALAAALQRELGALTEAAAGELATAAALTEQIAAQRQDVNRARSRAIAAETESACAASDLGIARTTVKDAEKGDASYNAESLRPAAAKGRGEPAAARTRPRFGWAERILPVIRKIGARAAAAPAGAAEPASAAELAAERANERAAQLRQRLVDRLGSPAWDRSGTPGYKVCVRAVPSEWTAADIAAWAGQLDVWPDALEQEGVSAVLKFKKDSDAFHAKRALHNQPLGAGAADVRWS